MANPPGTRVDIVVCQKHGLRYNRITDSGCAMCRREGTTAEPARPAASTGAVRAQPAPAAKPRPTAPPPAAARPAPPAPTPAPARALTPPSADVLPPLLPELPPAPEASTATGSRPLDVVTCEKHGLRYNRAAESGCVRCRRESGVATTAGTGPARASRLGAAVRLDAPSSIRIQLLIAVLLIGGTAGLCYAAHQAVLASFAGGLLVQTGNAGMDVVDDPGEAYGNDTTEPAAWPPPRPAGPQPTAPPGMKGRGPAEEQQQIEELFRQMQEDEAKERGEEPPPAEEIPQ